MAANGEFYLNYATNIFDNNYGGSYDGNPINFIARRKVWILDNFDNDTAGAVPGTSGFLEPGWQTLSGYTEGVVETSPTPSTDHPYSLQIEKSGSDGAVAEKVFEVNGNDTTAPSMDFHAEVYPVSLGGPVDGDDSFLGIALQDSGNNVFNMGIFPPGVTYAGTYTDYTVQADEGGTWEFVSHLGTAGILNEWHKVEVNATSTSSATVFVDNVVQGTIGNSASEPGIDRVWISAGGVEGTGANFYVDNVFLYPSQPGDTFENNATGSDRTMLPNGWTEVSTDGNAAILTSTTQAYTGGYSNPEGPGSQSMEIMDNSTSVYAAVSRIVDPTPSKWLEAQIYPASMGTNGCFSGIILGQGTGPGSYIYNIGIIPPSAGSTYGNYSDYTIQYYNGTAWGLVGTSPSAHLGTTDVLNTWHQIDVDATSTTGGSIYFEDTAGILSLIGTITNWGTASTMDRAEFYSASAAGTGFQEYVDNVYLAPAIANDDDFDFDAAGATAPFGYTVLKGTAPGVSTAEHYDGPNSYHVHDNSTAASVEKIVSISAPVPQAEGPGQGGKSIDFRVYPETISSAIYIDLDDGVSTAPNYDNTVFRLGIFPGGTLKYEGESNSGWKTWTGTTAPAGAWSQIDIMDNLEGSGFVTVIINGDAVAYGGNFTTVNNWHTAASIDRVVFSCATSTDDFYIDDVLMK